MLHFFGLQETALNHVRSAGLLGDGFGATPEMTKRNLIWVVSKIQVIVDHYPSWYSFTFTLLNGANPYLQLLVMGSLKKIYFSIPGLCLGKHFLYSSGRLLPNIYI